MGHCGTERGALGRGARRSAPFYGADCGRGSLGRRGTARASGPAPMRARRRRRQPHGASGSSAGPLAAPYTRRLQPSVPKVRSFPKLRQGTLGLKLGADGTDRVGDAAEPLEAPRNCPRRRGAACRSPSPRRIACSPLLSPPPAARRGSRSLASRRTAAEARPPAISARRLRRGRGRGVLRAAGKASESAAARSSKQHRAPLLDQSAAAAHHRATGRRQDGTGGIETGRPAGRPASRRIERPDEAGRGAAIPPGQRLAGRSVIGRPVRAGPAGARTGSARRRATRPREGRRRRRRGACAGPCRPRPAAAASTARGAWSGRAPRLPPTRTAARARGVRAEGRGLGASTRRRAGTERLASSLRARHAPPLPAPHHHQTCPSPPPNLPILGHSPPLPPFPLLPPARPNALLPRPSRCHPPFLPSLPSHSLGLRPLACLPAPRPPERPRHLLPRPSAAAQ